MDKIKGWVFNLLGGIFSDKSKEIQEIVDTQISEIHYKELEKWKAIYAGYYEEWLMLRYTTVNGEKKRRRHSLHMAKTSMAEMAKLIFSEDVEINISNEQHQKNIDDLLEKNRFYKVFQEKVEQMLSLGGLVLKAFPKLQPGGTTKLLINYITPDCFIPIAWENNLINEGAFLNVTRKGDKMYCLFEIHRWDYSNGQQNYVIKNVLYEKDNRTTTSAKEVELAVLYPDLEPVVTIQGLTQPLFQYIKPNIANNFDLQSPLGISVFANALDTLYAIDVAFDSFIREFRLGRRRIIVPATAVRTIIDPNTGQMHRYFDADDEVYQAMNFADPDKQKVTDNTVPLRVDEHVSAINALLNLYAVQIGFSAGSFTFDGVQVKTATEVISENSKTYQTVKSNEHMLEEGLEKFIYTLSEVAALYNIFPLPTEEYEIDFNWDDSIVGDKYQDTDWYIKLNTAGMISKKYSIMKILGFTEEQAEEMLKEILAEEQTSTPDINDVLSQTNPLHNMTPDDMTKMVNDKQINTDVQMNNIDGE